MGFYINPVTMTKEEWLMQNGRLLLRGGDYTNSDEECYVCLISNPGFLAAVIIYNSAEFKRFFNPKDLRKKWWFICRKEDVIKVSNITLEDFKEGK